MAKKPIYFSDLSYVEQPVVLVSGTKRYNGSIVKIALTKAFVKLNKPDATIHGLPRTAPLKLEFTDDNGMSYNMNSFLVSKKMPEIELEVTEKIQKLGEARQHPRTKCSIWSELVNAKRGADGKVVFEPYSDCTIVDVSVGGVKIVSGDDFAVGKMIVLAFFFDKLNRNIYFRGTVKIRRKARNELVGYGLEFYKPDQALLSVVEQIIENPEDV